MSERAGRPKLPEGEKAVKLSVFLLPREIEALGRLASAASPGKGRASSYCARILRAHLHEVGFEAPEIS